MKNNDTRYYIYIRSTKERVPCTKEEFDDYYRDINAFRQRQQYHNKCACPKSKFLDCDMDCITCPFRRDVPLSLDCPITGEGGTEMNLLDTLADRVPRLDDIVAGNQELAEVFAYNEEVMPEAIIIGRLRQQGLTERQIEAKIGVGRKTYAYRLKKLKQQLEKKFPEIF